MDYSRSKCNENEECIELKKVIIEMIKKVKGVNILRRVYNLLEYLYVNEDDE